MSRSRGLQIAVAEVRSFGLMFCRCENMLYHVIVELIMQEFFPSSPSPRPPTPRHTQGSPCAHDPMTHSRTCAHEPMSPGAHDFCFLCVALMTRSPHMLRSQLVGSIASSHFAVSLAFLANASLSGCPQCLANAVDARSNVAKEPTREFADGHRGGRIRRCVA